MVGTDIIGGDRHDEWGQTKTPWIQNPKKIEVVGRFLTIIIPLCGPTCKLEIN